MMTVIAALVIGIMLWVLLRWKERSRSIAAEERGNAASSPQPSLPDYREYTLTAKERMITVLVGGLMCGAISYVFFGSWVIVLLGLPCGFGLVRYRAALLRDRRVHTLRVQFKQALYSVSSSLGAGKSVEQAFADALQDMRLLYPQGTSLMIEELEVMLRKLKLGGTIEAAIADFSRRSGLEDARQFADVFSICKRTGGNLVEIVRRTSTIIGEKLEIEQDIAVLLAQKKFESKVLLAAPLVIVTVLRVTAAEYMAPLYEGGGRITMSAALLALIGCFALTRRIMRIGV
ncbi:type II secretion system F family protein [Paenibacillus chartarius]|uniref:Type II secretion system F family protein n=1 Tax=Paenibacillus chartarius TaxID=747481 RepID=A0ABV6DPW0_9BACL